MRFPSFARGLPSAMRDPIIMLAFVGLLLTIAASAAHAAEVKLFEEGEGLQFSQETRELYFGKVPATFTMVPVTRVGQIQDLLVSEPLAPLPVTFKPVSLPGPVLEVSLWLYPEGEEPCETQDGICRDMDEDYVYIDEAPPARELPVLPPDVRIVQASYHR